jgi:hypothetical protein
MCTYNTVQAQMTGSAKGPNGNWFRITDAAVYFDHPVHAPAEHTLNIDLTAPERGPSARVAIELTAESARDLVAAINAALATVPAELLVRPTDRIEPAVAANSGLTRSLATASGAKQTDGVLTAPAEPTPG